MTNEKHKTRKGQDTKAVKSNSCIQNASRQSYQMSSKKEAEFLCPSYQKEKMNSQPGKGINQDLQNPKPDKNG